MKLKNLEFCCVKYCSFSKIILSFKVLQSWFLSECFHYAYSSCSSFLTRMLLVIRVRAKLELIEHTGNGIVTLYPVAT